MSVFFLNDSYLKTWKDDGMVLLLYLLGINITRKETMAFFMNMTIILKTECLLFKTQS